MGEAVVVDDFLDDVDGVRHHATTLDYSGVRNPADGVFYKGVSIDVENRLQAEYVYKLSKLFGREIHINYMFFRLSVTSNDAPYQVHTDALMGTHAAIIYLNDIDTCKGGTELVCHRETGLGYNPIDDKELAVWDKDQNTPDKWDRVEFAEMKPNRMVLIDAAKMHRSLPIGGFGDSVDSGRIVLTCFFSVFE